MKNPYNIGGDLIAATVKDPFGNVIGLIYDPYFEIKNQMTWLQTNNLWIL